MNAFRFRLDRVLALRRTQVEVEEARLQQETAVMQRLDQARATLSAQWLSAESELRRRSAVTGGELAALSDFRQFNRGRERMIDAERAACETRVAGQQRKVTEARRHCRLLERLKERRLAEWKSALDRETETFASEAFLAKWNRESRRNATRSPPPPQAVAPVPPR